MVIHILLLLWLCVVTYSRFNRPDCSLNGDHINSDCICDPGWKGLLCDILDVQPVNNSGYKNTSNYSSWGGNSIFVDGQYHLFAAQFVRHCNLDHWGTNSHIIHATSETIDGPFKYVETVVDVWSHNPTIRQAPDGTFVLFMIGTGTTVPGKIATCNSSKLTREAPRSINTSSTFTSAIYVTWSSSIHGPWPQPVPVVFEDVSPELWKGRYNPSPHFNIDGSVYLAFNAGPEKPSWPKSIAQEYPGIAISHGGSIDDTTSTSLPPWVGPFKLMNKGLPVFPKKFGCLGGTGEDPFIWKDRRGLKMIIHGMCPTGIMQAHYAYSNTNGSKWYISSEETYSYNVEYLNRQDILYARVERPQLTFNKEMNPILLWNGVCQDFGCLGILGGKAGRSFTLARPIGKKHLNEKIKRI